jgi:HK97 family phage major capsid protein
MATTTDPGTPGPDSAAIGGSNANGTAGGETGTTGAVPTLTHSGCVNRLRDIRAQMGQIAELDTPSAQDDAYFRELAAEFDMVDAHRLNLERQATLGRIRSTTDTLNVPAYLRAERGSGGEAHDGANGYDRDPMREPDSIEENRFRSPWATQDMRTMGRPPEQVAAEFRSRAISACAQMQGATDPIRQAATEILERWDDQDASLSQLALALSAPAYYRAWSKLARADGVGVELTEDERMSVSNVRRVARSTRAMSLTDAAGGYLVPFQLDPTVIITANGSVNQIRQVARQVVAIGDVWNGVSAGAVSWSYDAEAAEVSDDSPTFAPAAIPIYKAQGFVPISVEAIQDAANVAAEVGSLLAFGRDVLEANAFAVGTGVAMPTGIVTSLTGGSSIVTSTTTDVFALADLYKLQGSLPARYRNQPGTAWLGNNLIYNLARQFTAGNEVWGSLSEGRLPSLLGRPVLESEDMDGTITAAAENPILIHGDFSNFVIADRIGMTVEFIPHLFGATRRPTGQRGWLAYVRHGSDSVNDAAFRMLNVT